MRKRFIASHRIDRSRSIAIGTLAKQYPRGATRRGDKFQRDPRRSFIPVRFNLTRSRDSGIIKTGAELAARAKPGMWNATGCREFRAYLSDYDSIISSSTEPVPPRDSRSPGKKNLRRDSSPIAFRIAAGFNYPRFYDSRVNLALTPAAILLRGIFTFSTERSMEFCPRIKFSFLKKAPLFLFSFFVRCFVPLCNFVVLLQE